MSLNTHEIEAEEPLGIALMRSANRPAPHNPKTSALTAASLAATEAALAIRKATLVAREGIIATRLADLDERERQLARAEEALASDLAAARDAENRRQAEFAEAQRKLAEQEAKARQAMAVAEERDKQVSKLNARVTRDIITAEHVTYVSKRRDNISLQRRRKLLDKEKAVEQLRVTYSKTMEQVRSEVRGEFQGIIAQMSACGDQMVVAAQAALAKCRREEEAARDERADLARQREAWTRDEEARLAEWTRRSLQLERDHAEQQAELDARKEEARVAEATAVAATARAEQQEVKASSAEDAARMAAELSRDAAHRSDEQARVYQHAAADMQDAAEQHHINGAAALMREGDALKIQSQAEQSLAIISASSDVLRKGKMAVARSTAILDAVLPEHEARWAALELARTEIKQGRLTSVAQLKKRDDLAPAHEDLLPVLGMVERLASENKVAAVAHARKDRELAEREQKVASGESDYEKRSANLKRREKVTGDATRLRAALPVIEALCKYHSNTGIMRVPGLANLLKQLNAALASRPAGKGRGR